MLKHLRASLKRRRRLRDLEKKLARLQQRYVELDWKPFQEVTRFFSDKSLSSLEEQAFLYRLAAQLPPDSIVVEIGSWIGHSSCVLASALRGTRAHIYAIDPFSAKTTVAQERQLFSSFLAKVSATMSQRELFDLHLDHFDLSGKVRSVPFESAEAVRLLPADLQVDMVFIDGGHTLDDVRSDIVLYLPLVRRGGVVAFHDFSSECGVPAAVWEAIQRGTFNELVGIHASLLALRKN